MPATCFAKSQRHQFQEPEQRRRLDQVDRNIDVAASGVGIRAHATLAFHLSPDSAETFTVWPVAAYTLSSRSVIVAPSQEKCLSHLSNATYKNTASIATWAKTRIDCTMVAVDTLVGGRSPSDRVRYEARGRCDCRGRCVPRTARREPPHLRRSRHAIGRYHRAIDSPPCVWSDRSCISHSI
jgi:hypothetical protein